jgi:hypothetical protein
LGGAAVPVSATASRADPDENESGKPRGGGVEARRRDYREAPRRLRARGGRAGGGDPPRDRHGETHTVEKVIGVVQASPPPGRLLE